MNSSDLAGRYSLLRTHVMHEVSDSSPAPEASGQFVHFADSPFELFQPYPPAGDLLGAQVGHVGEVRDLVVRSCRR